MDIQSITSDIRDVAGNLQFPAHKDDVLNQAKEQGKGSDVLGLLQKLPSQNFGSVEELLNKLPLGGALGEAEHFL